MLCKQTISPFLEKKLKELMLIEELNEYLLVGGTGLSLQLGHRTSDDIDLFRPDYKTGEEMLPLLRKYYPHVNISNIGFGLAMYLPIPDSVKTLKVDICSNEPFIRPYIIDEGIRIAHIEDIAAMKFEAITTRLEKKDFWDIAELLERYSFMQIGKFYNERYPYNDLKDVIVRISQSSKCDEQPDPVCLNGKTWKNIKEIINKSLDKYISEEIDNKQKLFEIKETNVKGSNKPKQNKSKGL